MPKTSTRSATKKSTGSAKQSPAKTPARTKQAASDSRLEEFLTDELKDIYWAEKKLVKTLPKLQKAATLR